MLIVNKRNHFKQTCHRERWGGGGRDRVTPHPIIKTDTDHNQQNVHLYSMTSTSTVKYYDQLSSS